MYEKVYMSPRPHPKISLKHDWKRELGSEKDKLCNHLEVPNRANQFQTQIMIERGHPLWAATQGPRQVQEKRPVLRRSKHVLFMKKLLHMIERRHSLFAVTQVTRKVPHKHVHLVTARASKLKIKQIMTERGHPLFAVNEVNIDFRILGLPHSVVKQAEPLVRNVQTEAPRKKLWVVNLRFIEQRGTRNV